MNFSSALYYPSIDISDESWLKSAVLFWDEINTIVPYSIKNPYNNDSTLYLNSEGILNPITVKPSSRYVRKASREAGNYIFSLEGLQMLNNQESAVVLSPNESMTSFLHSDKINFYFLYKIQSIMKVEEEEDEFYRFDSRLVDLYMTILANNISEDKSIAVVSNNYTNNRFVNSVRYDINTNNPLTIRNSDIAIKQGLLTNYVIDNLIISDSTSLKDIVDFRKHHKDELARFRSNLSKLVEPIEDVPSLEALQQRIKTIYNDEFIPAYHDLQKALRSSRIKWFFDNLSKLCVFSVSTTAIPIALGLDIPQAILLGGGISVASSVVAYNAEKEKKLRENPYTYLLRVNKELT